MKIFLGWVAVGYQYLIIRSAHDMICYEGVGVHEILGNLSRYSSRKVRKFIGLGFHHKTSSVTTLTDKTSAIVNY